MKQGFGEQNTPSLSYALIGGGWRAAQPVKKWVNGIFFEKYFTNNLKHKMKSSKASKMTTYFGARSALKNGGNIGGCATHLGKDMSRRLKKNN